MKKCYRRLLGLILAILMLLSMVNVSMGETEEERPTLTISFSNFTPGQNWMTEEDVQYVWKYRLMEETGVNLEFVGNRYGCLGTEQLLLLIADDSLPDIYFGPDLFASTSTTPAIMIEDGYLLRLNDYMDQIPNFVKFLDENPQYAASAMLEDGTLFGFPQVNSHEVTKGLMLRGDWLDELNMEVPCTPAQLKEFLIAARDQFGATYPLYFQSEYLEYIMPRGWDNGGTRWYVEDGIVKFGALEPGFKEFVTEMALWYAEGLIDPDMPSASKQSVEAAMSNGSAAAVFNQLPKIENMYDFNADNPGYRIVGTNLSVNGDAVPKFGGAEGGLSWGNALYINPECEHLDDALRFCDYMFSEEGILLNNYGTQGISYDFDENGNIVEAGYLLDDTIEVSDFNKLYALAKRGSWAGVVTGQNFGYREDVVAVAEEWKNTLAPETEPPAIVFTQEENDAYASAWNDCYTFYQENVLKFVIGTKPIEEFDAFMAQLHQLGIDECVSIRQEAYNRYLEVYNRLIAE